MKIILSRKGFDSANGGIVSPIFEDGSMISFPIPSSDNDTYDDLQFDDIPYSEILSNLKYKGTNQKCHVDPDLDDKRRKKKIDGWVPAFGQISSSASYLKNVGVTEGDIFLFFGNFHCVTKDVAGKYSYIKRTGDFYKDNDLQVIWGYLQVGEILDSADEQKKLWWHPHAMAERTSVPTNIIFKAAKSLCFDERKPGAGLLTFDKKRVLTLEGANKATWRMNSVYDVENIDVMKRRQNKAKDTLEGIYYPGIWQELGLKESAACTEWAKNIIL